MNNSSNVNTILLVVILVVLVGAGIWWYQSYGPGAPQPAENGIDIHLGGSSNGNQ